jgi:hypothetical protein
VSLAGVCAWRLYVGGVLFSDWGATAFLFSPRDLGFPLFGIATLWSKIAHAQYYPEVREIADAGIWYPLLLMSAAGVAVVTMLTVPSAPGVAGLCYAAIAISLNFDNIWTHVGNAQRGTFELFVALALVTLNVRRFSRWVQWALIAFWAFSAAYVFFGAFDSFYVREAILKMLPAMGRIAP